MKYTTKAEKKSMLKNNTKPLRLQLSIEQQFWCRNKAESSKSVFISFLELNKAITKDFCEMLLSCKTTSSTQYPYYKVQM